MISVPLGFDIIVLGFVATMKYLIQIHQQLDDYFEKYIDLKAVTRTDIL